MSNVKSQKKIISDVNSSRNSKKNFWERPQLPAECASRKFPMIQHVNFISREAQRQNAILDQFQTSHGFKRTTNGKRSKFEPTYVEVPETCDHVKATLWSLKGPDFHVRRIWRGRVNIFPKRVNLPLSYKRKILNLFAEKPFFYRCIFVEKT